MTAPAASSSSYESGLLVQVASTIANISNGMRCVPDAAMDADPNSGYNIIVGGKQTTVGGTVPVP